jgi:DNA-binding ferritin-like protein
MLNEIKIYHWNTHSYSQHKATDELYAKLNEHIDKFIEVLLGKKSDRITNLSKHIPLHTSASSKSFRDKILHYRDYLIDMDHCFNEKTDTDLLNIRDEILADINQFLYLLTLNK